MKFILRIYKILKKLLKYSVILFLGFLLLSYLASCPARKKSSSTSSSSTYKSKLPPLKTYGISAGMSPQEVARQLEGKVEGLDQIGSKRLRNIATGELDGSYISVYTHSLYYNLKNTSRRLRVYFWDDKVKDIMYK